jgi:hypothetical protein
LGSGIGHFGISQSANKTEKWKKRRINKMKEKSNHRHEQ